MSEPFALSGYYVELRWGWGQNWRFDEVARFHVATLDEIDAHVQREIKRIAERFAFDCGRLDYPLNPWLTGLRITPVASSWYRPTTQYDEAMQAAVESKRRELEARQGVRQ